MSSPGGNGGRRGVYRVITVEQRDAEQAGKVEPEDYDDHTGDPGEPGHDLGRRPLQDRVYEHPENGEHGGETGHEKDGAGEQVTPSEVSVSERGAGELGEKGGDHRQHAR